MKLRLVQARLALSASFQEAESYSRKIQALDPRDLFSAVSQ